MCNINPLRVYSVILIPLGCTSTVYLHDTEVTVRNISCREGMGDQGFPQLKNAARNH